MNRPKRRVKGAGLVLAPDRRDHKALTAEELARQSGKDAKRRKVREGLPR